MRNKAQKGRNKVKLKPPLDLRREDVGGFLRDFEGFSIQVEFYISRAYFLK